MSDLLKEFEDDIKRERSEKRWKDFGKQLVNVSIAVVIGTIGAVVWKHYTEGQAVKQTNLLLRGVARMEVEDYKGAIAAFSEAADKVDEDIYGIVMLRKAEAQLALGDQEGAKQTFSELSKHNGHDDAFAAIAQLHAAQDSGAVIQPAKGAPFYHMQMEWKGWQLLDQGKKEEATQIFASLQDDADTPTEVRGRAAEALQLLAPEMLVPDAPEAAPDAK